MVFPSLSWYAGFGLGGFCSWVWFWHGPGLVVGFYVIGWVLGSAWFVGGFGSCLVGLLLLLQFDVV